MAREAQADAEMGRLCVRLLRERFGGLDGAAEAAIARGLAGLFRSAVDAEPGHAAARALDSAARREAFDDASNDERTTEALSALAEVGTIPLVFKGRMLATSLWPRPEFRPPGDADLLVDYAQAPAALAALARIGYRSWAADPATQFRQRDHSVEFTRPGDRMPLVVDLHVDPFRSVGSGIRGEDVLARSSHSTLGGVSIRVLDDADRLLICFVHAAKHGMRSLKWLLDCWAIASASDSETWSAAWDRAGAARTTRPFAAAAASVMQLPGVAIPARCTVMPATVRPAVGRLIRLDLAIDEVPRTRAQARALEVVLEESPRLVAKRAWAAAKRRTRRRGESL